MWLLVLFYELTEAVKGIWPKLKLESLDSPYIVELSLTPIKNDFNMLIFVYTHDFIMGMHLFGRKSTRLLKALKGYTICKENIMSLLSQFGD